jgi:hypothetical protein
MAYTAHITMRTYQRRSSGATRGRVVAIALLLKVPDLAWRLASATWACPLQATQRNHRGTDRAERIEAPRVDARDPGANGLTENLSVC